MSKTQPRVPQNRKILCKRTPDVLNITTDHTELQRKEKGQIGRCFLYIEATVSEKGADTSNRKTRKILNRSSYNRASKWSVSMDKWKLNLQYSKNTLNPNSSKSERGSSADESVQQMGILCHGDGRVKPRRSRIHNVKWLSLMTK